MEGSSLIIMPGAAFAASTAPTAGPCPIARVGRNPHPQGRDIAVGDVHGCFTALQAALAKIGFDPLMDRLFSVGDLVDRGPESAHVLNWLAKPWLRAVMGNHEFLAWRSALGNPYDLVSHERNGGEWLGQLEGESRKAVGEALRALPVAMEVETRHGVVGIIHADCPYDDWEHLRLAALDRDEAADQDFEQCLWGYGRYECKYAGVVKNIRAVVHGHVAIRERLLLGNVHFIDTGGWRAGGKFTLLDLETLEPAKPASRR